MPLTQHNGDILPFGTTASGKGGQPYSGSIEARLSQFAPYGQCQDAWGVYSSPRERERKRLEREGHL